MMSDTITSSAHPSDLSPRRVERDFRDLIAGGVRLRAVGTARDDPSALLSQGYTPKHMYELFDASFFLTNLRENEHFRFFVAYVMLPPGSVNAPQAPTLFARIFYKDSSLVWRSPTHYIHTDEDVWIGKGDLKWVTRPDGIEEEYSAEETTNLPLEMQATLDDISRRRGRVIRDHRATGLILHNAPNNRFRPYRDFSEPRRRAMARPGGRINDGDYVAWFDTHNDPASLRFAPGFEPDLDGGVVEISRLRSWLYGGAIQKFRIVSVNREIQYQFIAAPRHVWIIPPQALTTELSSYGVRTVDVNADEHLFVPGYEYHFIDEDEDPPALHTQIPPGFAGTPSDVDDSRADASPWLDRLPIIREFRRVVLGEM